VVGLAALASVGLVGSQAILAQASTPTAGQTVAYQGIGMTVPSSWPVIQLADDPGHCVRFDQHGLYLGRPAEHQRCPARALGHTESAIIEPLSTTEVSRAMVGLHHSEIDGQLVGMATRSAIQPDYTLVFPAAHVEVVISQGTSPTVAAGIFSSLAASSAPVSAAPETGASNPSIGSVTPVSPPLASSSATAPASTAPASTAPASTAPVPASTPSLTTSPSTNRRISLRASALTAQRFPVTAEAATLLSYSVPQPGTYTGGAFDTCEAPSTSTMSDWLASPYRAANIYIGGVNEGCPSQPNLSSSWVSQVSAMGFSIIPTYVGLQAPCASGAYGAGIDPSQAASQGRQSADQAVGEASSLGLGAGSPIYDDMESYDSTNASCNQAVLAFLDGWTRELHAQGYASGVYSSLYGAIRALVSAVGAGYQLPDDIWFAAWPGNGATTTDPTIPAGEWANHQRIHQYVGGVTQTWGGATINVDQDYADALLAAHGSGGAAPLSNRFQLNAGQVLNPGQSVVSPNGQYNLVMQSDGNLVLYVVGERPLWDTSTWGHPGAYAVMRTDGNLVVYGSGRALWASGTSGNPGAGVNVQSDANVVVYSNYGRALWDSGRVNAEMTPNGTLQDGWMLISPNRQYELVMQADGNLVLYLIGQRALWSTGTWGHPGAYAVMRTDGNLVVYGSGRALWASNTSGYPGAYSVLQVDGNLVVYGAGRALWASGT